MRVFTVLAALAMLAGIVVDDKPFTFKKGSAMTYSDSRFGEDGSVDKSTSTWTVDKVDGDNNYLLAVSGNSKHTFVFSYANGFFNWGNTDAEGNISAGLPAFKLNSKKGDTWTPGEHVTLTYVGDEEITVPAGKFTCKKVMLDVDGHMRVTFHFADKVGLVKGHREFSLNGTDFTVQATIELQKFVEGK